MQAHASLQTQVSKMINSKATLEKMSWTCKIVSLYSIEIYNCSGKSYKSHSSCNKGHTISIL